MEMSHLADRPVLLAHVVLLPKVGVVPQQALAFDARLRIHVLVLAQARHCVSSRDLEIALDRYVRGSMPRKESVVAREVESVGHELARELCDFKEANNRANFSNALFPRQLPWNAFQSTKKAKNNQKFLARPQLGQGGVQLRSLTAGRCRGRSGPWPCR